LAIELKTLAEVGGTLGKALGTLFKDTGKTVLDRVRARYAAHLPEPPNHDLQIALRLSGLGAAQIILANERRLIEAEGAREAPELRFVAAAEAWVSQAIPLLPTQPLAPNEPLVAALEAALDHILPGGDVAQLRATMRAAETLAWAELTANAAGHAPPETLVTAFRGNSAEEPGWSLLFLALIRETLKSTPKANIAYTTSRLARIFTLFDTLEQLAEAHHAGSMAAHDKTHTNQVSAESSAERRHQEQLQVTESLRLEIAREKGVPPHVLVPLFAYLGHHNLTVDEMRHRAEETIQAILARADQAVVLSKMYSPVVRWVGSARNEVGFSAQLLQMNSCGVSPRRFLRRRA